MNKPIPTLENRFPNGLCDHCGTPAVPFGCFCPACYGGVLHPDGLPMVPGDPDDPYRAFKAEADAGIADRKMPKHVGFAIMWNVYQRIKKKHQKEMNRRHE